MLRQSAPLNLINVYVLFLKYGFYIPCKYCFSIPYQYCRRENKHNEYHIIQEKYDDLNEKYKHLEIILNSLIDMIHQNNDNINEKVSELLRSINFVIDNKLSDIDHKLSILEKKGIKMPVTKSNNCYKK